MRAIRTLPAAALVSWLLPFSVILGAETAPLTASRAQHEFGKRWWETLKPECATATEQLQYADDLREKGELKRASGAYRALVFNWPRSAEAPVAQFNYADCLDRRGLYNDAFQAYGFLMDIYSGFFSHDEVIARQVAIALKVADRKRRFLFFEYSSPEDAIPLFEEIINRCPRCKGVPDLQYRIGEIHEKAGHHEQAAEAYQEYLRIAPSGPLAAQACFGYASCLYRIARKNSNNKGLRAGARGALEYFLASFPESDMTAQATAWVNELCAIQASAYYNEALDYEKSAGRARDAGQRIALYKAAKMVYERLIREHPGSRWATVAKVRLEDIEGELEKHHER